MAEGALMRMQAGERRGVGIIQRMRGWRVRSLQGCTIPLLALLAVLGLSGCTSRVARVAPTAGIPATRSATAAPAATETDVPGPPASLTPVPTATATPRPTSTPTRTPSTTPTSTPSPTSTPTPSLLQLTEGGCCTQPFWSPDGQEVRFIDKPAGQSVGIYGVALGAPLTTPRFVSQRLEDSLATGGYVVLRNGNTTTIERVADGASWTVPARGRNVLISPGAARIAWTLSDDDLPPEQQVTQVWVAGLQGEDARRVATLRRGGVSGWIDEETLLVSGREAAGARDQVLWALSVTDGSLRELARAERLRSATLSPSGAWVAYYTTFESETGRNGLWLVPTRVELGTGSAPRAGPQRSEVFGAYQWRPCPGGCTAETDRLVIVPFDPKATWHEFWQLDPRTLSVEQLTQGEVTPVKIANGDWRVGPDGKYVVFVASADRNLWVVQLP